MWLNIKTNHKIMHVLFLAVVLMYSITSTIAWAKGGAVVNGFGSSLTTPEQTCYGVSMVGYDSVINSRLGVPAEHALELAYVNVEDQSTYQPFLLKVILDAYLWYETPHAYAVKVMFSCAVNATRLQTAASMTE